MVIYEFQHISFVHMALVSSRITLTFQCHVTSSVIRFAIGHILLVVICNRASTFSRF